MLASPPLSPTTVPRHPSQGRRRRDGIILRVPASTGSRRAESSSVLSVLPALAVAALLLSAVSDAEAEEEAG